MNHDTRLLTSILALLIWACGGPSSDSSEEDQRIIAFDTTSMRLVSGGDSIRLTVELARTPEQKTMGLMERHHLSQNAGMLFVYDSTQSADAGFWMFRTRIPLDIAFMDSSGVVRAVRAMTPCESMLAQGCPTYKPGVPYRYALEVNSGYLARHHIAVGAVALLPNALPANRR